MRIILKFVQIIILLYLVALLLVKFFFITQDYLYNNDYPSIKGYSIVKVMDNNLSPDVTMNEYLILKKEKDYKINDIVYIKDSKLVKITNIIYDENNNILKYEADKNEISSKNIYAKSIYRNEFLSKVIIIISHPIFILVLIGCLIAISSKTYKRY